MAPLRQFMQLTRCPPPVEPFPTFKQLNNEAQSWLYDVAVLRIEATGSFAHTNFFEEAFSQVARSALSPTKDIRKAEMTHGWDTTWLRSSQAGCANTLFPVLFRQRAISLVGILLKAPSLNEMIIHWHDSAQGDGSVDLMNDTLIDFPVLDALVKVERHYTAPDAKPSAGEDCWQTSCRVPRHRRQRFGLLVLNSVCMAILMFR